MESMRSYKKAVFPIVLAVLQVAVILYLILVNFMDGGYKAGLFDMEDILFEGISSLANKSDYEIAIDTGRSYAFFALLVVGGILLVVYLKSKARKNMPPHVGLRMTAQILTNTSFLSFSFLILMYEFDGITRILLYPAMLISAALYLYITAKYSVRVGASALILHILAFLAAFYIVWLLCPLLGALFAIFGDIFSFFVVALLLTGGCAVGVHIVRVWII